MLVLFLLEEIELNFPEEMTSPTYKSNQYTMRAVATEKPELSLPSQPYTMPSKEVRELRARLILEECLEKLGNLGFKAVTCFVEGERGFSSLAIPRTKHRLEFTEGGDVGTVVDIVDDCIDIIYVATGTLVAMGVPDIPHLLEVNRANNAKFPEGKPYGLREDGKFLKPPDWKEPNHSEVRSRVLSHISHLQSEMTDEYFKDPRHVS